MGYDAGLPGGGLLIYHVDEGVATNQDEWHPKVALVQVTGGGGGYIMWMRGWGDTGRGVGGHGDRGEGGGYGDRGRGGSWRQGEGGGHGYRGRGGSWRQGEEEGQGGGEGREGGRGV